MAFQFLLLFSLLNLAFAGNHGALPEEVHWKSVFPNTPMPKALKDLLQPSVGTNNHGDSSNGMRSVNGGDPTHPFIIYDKEDPSKKFRRVKDGPINPFIIYDKEDSSKPSKRVNDGPINPFIIYENKDSSKPSKSVNDGPINPFIIYEKKDSSKASKRVNDGPINPFIIYENKDSSKASKRVNDGPINPFIIYDKEGTNKKFKGHKNSLGGNHENAAINENIYFFQEDLHAGKMVNLPLLTKTRDTATFLSYRVAESIPFSSDKLPEIIMHFSFQPESREANAVKETIKACERQVIPGEEMYCATSFESFVDSSVSMLGKNIQLLSNELGKETENPVFTIGREIKNMGEEEVVCHKMPYPSAVFLCHSIEKTIVYRVPLVGIDTKANALAICHKDTSAWNAEHPAFRSLKVNPGTVPICHFVVRDTLVWVRK